MTLAEQIAAAQAKVAASIERFADSGTATPSERSAIDGQLCEELEALRDLKTAAQKAQPKEPAMPTTKISESAVTGRPGGCDLPVHVINDNGTTAEIRIEGTGVYLTQGQIHTVESAAIKPNR